MLSEKDSYNMFTKSIAHQFSDQFSFFHVVVPDKDPSSSTLPDKLRSTSLPSLAIARGESGEISFYSGSMSDRDSILSWLKSFDHSSTEGDSSTLTPLGQTLSDPSLLTDSSLSPSQEHVILVVESDASIESFLPSTSESSSSASSSLARFASICDGSILSSELRCGAWLQKAAEEGKTLGEGSGPTQGTLGEQLCKHLALSGPFATIVPYGELARKKLRRSSDREIQIDKLKLLTNQDSSLLQTLEKKLGSSLPESAVSVISDFHVGAEEALSQNLLREGIQSKKLNLFVFSEKKTLPVVLKNIALSHSNLTHVAFFAESRMEVARSFGAKKLPFIVAMFPMLSPKEQTTQEGTTNAENPEEGEGASQVSFQPVPFDSGLWGPLSHQSLSKFILHLTSQPQYFHHASGDPSSSSSSSSSSQSGSASLVVRDLDEPSQWSQACGYPGEGVGFRGVCILHIHNNPPSPSSPALSSSGLDEEQKEILSTLPSALASSSSLAALSGALRLVRINGVCQPSLLSALDLTLDALPAVVALSPSKGKMGVYRGAMNKANVRDYVSSILAGKTSIHPVPASLAKSLAQSNLPLVSGCEAGRDVWAAPEEPAQEEADEDFLAEILREEQEKAASLKKAVEEEAKRLAEEKKAQEANKKSKSKKTKKSKKSKKSKSDDEL